MSFNTIRIEIDDRGVATLILARSEKHNAMNAEMIGEIHRAAEELGSNDDVRVIVLAGEGKSFCAGGDLGWMREQAEKDRAGKISESTKLAEMLLALDELSKPLIGKVEGNAFGGGIGMMAVCDVVVAKAGAKFALTETRLGLIPATIGPYVVRRLREGHARRCFMNAKVFDAAEAQRIGLVSVVAENEDVDRLVEEEVAAFLNCAPGAVASAKSLCKKLARTPDGGNSAATIADTIEALADRWESDECQAGIEAFFARKDPPWKVD